MNPFPTRIKLLGATAVLAAGLGVASVNGAFTGHTGVAQAQTAPATPTAVSSTPPTTSAAPPSASGTPPSGPGPFGRGPGGPGGPGRGWRGFGGPGGGSASEAALATFLGLNATDLETALHGGQTLAQVAQAHGKTTADLKTFLTGQLKTRLDAQVAAGTLTAQQETDRLTAASTRIDQQINGTFPGGRPGGPGGPGGPKGFGGRSAFQTVASTLGINVSDIQTELRAGKTLTQIAQEHGKTAADLKTALLNAYSTQIDQLLTTNFQQLRSQHQPPAPGTPAPTATPAG